MGDGEVGDEEPDPFRCHRPAAVGVDGQPVAVYDDEVPDRLLRLLRLDRRRPLTARSSSPATTMIVASPGWCAARRFTIRRGRADAGGAPSRRGVSGQQSEGDVGAWTVKVAGSLRLDSPSAQVCAGEGADIVILATASPTPVIDAEWVGQGAYVDHPGTQAAGQGRTCWPARPASTGSSRSGPFEPVKCRWQARRNLGVLLRRPRRHGVVPARHSCARSRGRSRA